MSKLIPLTQGKFAIVDDDDFSRLNEHTWHAVKMKRKHFDDYYYAARDICGVRVWMHKEILISENDIDHKDHNGLNNQKINLRSATRTENCRNRRYRDKGLPRGVTLQNGKYRARICIGNNKNKSLGMFDNIEDATQAYDSASLGLHREFGIRNEVRP